MIPPPAVSRTTARTRRASALRLTESSLLAAMRPTQPIEVADPNLLDAAGMVIRPLAWTDRDEFLRVMSVSRRQLQTHFPMHREGEADEALFERLIETAARGLELRRAWRAACFSIDRPARLLGMVNLNDIVRGLECSGEINWWTAADATGRGVATEAVRTVLAHAFGDLPRGLGLQRVTALIAPDNIASHRVAVKAGLRPVVAAPRGRGMVTRELVLNGQPVAHRLFEAFAPLTGPGRPATRRLRPRAGVHRGLTTILSTEAAVRADGR